MRTKLICVMLLVMPVLLCGMMKDPMEGTQWKVTISPEDGGKDLKDVFVFKGGMFWTESFKKEGFEPQEYDGDTRGIQTAKFTVTLTGKDKTTLAFNGSIIAGEMTGDMVKTKPDGTKVRYTFKSNG